VMAELSTAVLCAYSGSEWGAYADMRTV